MVSNELLERVEWELKPFFYMQVILALVAVVDNKQKRKKNRLNITDFWPINWLNKSDETIWAFISQNKLKYCLDERRMFIFIFSYHMRIYSKKNNKTNKQTNTVADQVLKYRSCRSRKVKRSKCNRDPGSFWFIFSLQ